MEIGITAVSSWTSDPFMEAVFTFVARDRTTGRASRINPLDLTSTTEAELQVVADGDVRAKERKERRKAAQERTKLSPVGGTLDGRGIMAARDLLEEVRHKLVL